MRPVVTLLEEDARTLVLVHPQHLRAVPGRKTDVKASEWRADPARGRGSCSRAVSRRLPAGRSARLTRQRKALVRAAHPSGEPAAAAARGRQQQAGSCRQRHPGQERAGHVGRARTRRAGPPHLGRPGPGPAAREVARVAPCLAWAGPGLSPGAAPAGARASGRSRCRNRPRAASTRSPSAWSPLTRRSRCCRRVRAWGRVRRRSWSPQVGTDLQRFPSACAAQALGLLGERLSRLCPGNTQSAGKRLGGKTTGGNVWLKAVLSEVAWANARNPTTYLGAQFRRLAHRRGVYTALVAVAHSVLVIV